MNHLFSKDNRLKHFVTKHKFLTALIITAVFSLAYILANGFKITGGNDDYCAFKVFLGGNTAIPCLSYFLTSFCVWAQPLFGVINVYMVFQELICFFSIAAINYFFISKLGMKKGLFYTVIFDLIFLSFLIVDILFTYTSAVAATSGLLCLFYGSIHEKRRRFKILQLISGFFLLLIGSEFRIFPFLVCCYIGAVFAVGVFVSYTAKNRKSEGIKKAFFSALKKYGITGILLIAAVVSALGINTASDSLKNSSQDYRELYDYNVSLSSVVDTKISPLYSNIYEFEEIGLKTEYDLHALRNWFVDDSFFTVDRLDRLAEIIREDNYDGLLNKSMAEKTLYSFKSSFSELIENRFILLYLLILILAVFSVFFFSIMFPKRKWLLIKLFLLAFLWSFFFIISNVFKLESLLLLPLAAISLMITLRYNRFQAVITLFVILGLLFPYSYLVSIRLLFYTSFSPIFPAFVLIIFGLDEENAVVIEKRPKLSKVALSVLAVMIAAVSAFSGVCVFINNVRISDQECNPLMEEYIEAHPDTIFLVNQTMLMKAYYDPFILPSEKTNIVNYGLWLTKAKYFKDSQKLNGIDNPFKDAIDSNMRIIFWEDDISYGEDEKKLPLFYLNIFYNDHYAESGKKIDIVRTDRVGNYSLYAIISEPVPAEEQ